jgi:uncharacterized membrane protein YphA (DoxX/SURF4 family)
MNVVLWVAQGLLAAAYLMSGGMKLTRPKEALIEARMGWAEDFPAGVVKAIGAAEVLGALGLILPTLTGILPFLTPLAAAGLVVIMIGATFTHIRRGEMVPNAIVVIVLGLIVFFIAYGRFAVVPLA